MSLMALIIMLLVIGAVWIAGLAVAIFFFYSNLRKYDSNEKPFDRSYYKKLIAIAIILPVCITAAVVAFFILFTAVF